MSPAELLESLEPMIASIASEYGRRHRVHGADVADFQQELCLWVLENRAKVDEWLDSDLYSPEHGARILAKSLRNQAKDYSVDIKAQAVGYKRDDLHWYAKGELRTLLPAMFDPEKWHEPPQSDGRSVKSYAEGNNWVAILSDVSRAFDALPKADREILVAFHKDDYTNKLAAEEWGVSEQVMSYRHDKAVERLQKALGGPKPEMRQGDTRDPFRGRHAVSNARAQAMTRGSYDDE